VGGGVSRGTHRRRLLLAVTGAAVVAVAIAVAVSHGSGNDRPAPSAAVAGGRAIERRLAGIPQDGVSLGSPRAPVTLWSSPTSSARSAPSTRATRCRG
jgi:hypothetical protein